MNMTGLRICVSGCLGTGGSLGSCFIYAVGGVGRSSLAAIYGRCRPCFLKLSKLVCRDSAAVIRYEKVQPFSFQLTGDTDVAVTFPAGKAMLHAVFHKRLKKKDGQLHRKKFRRNIDVEAEFPRKADVLDRHVTLYLLQFFLKRCNREFFQVVADQIGHAGGDRFNLRNLMNSGKSFDHI